MSPNFQIRLLSSSKPPAEGASRLPGGENSLRWSQPFNISLFLGAYVCLELCARTRSLLLFRMSVPGRFIFVRMCTQDLPNARFCTTWWSSTRVLFVHAIYFGGHEDIITISTNKSKDRPVSYTLSSRFPRRKLLLLTSLLDFNLHFKPHADIFFCSRTRTRITGKRYFGE